MKVKQRQRKPVPAKAKKATKWSRAMRAASLAHGADGIEAAKQAFGNLSRAAQLTLVREAVTTRSRELCLAFPDVVAIGWGHKQQLERKTLRPPLTPQICVAFTVKRKWRSDKEASPKRELPTHIMTYADLNGERVLCAIPTDVHDSSRNLNIKSQSAPTGISTYSPTDRIPCYGAVACLVERPDFGSGLFGISCRHVLSITERIANSGSGLAVCVRGTTQAAIGRTLSVAGDLGPAFNPSFDAQLINALNVKSIRQTMGGVAFTRAQDRSEAFPDEYCIITPNGVKKATFTLFHPTYKYDAGVYMAPGLSTFSSLIESHAIPATIGGDSGSPVATSETDGVFLGMHIAGDESTGQAFMIPAWELLSPANYHQLVETPWQLA